jgi:hypothetical protein
MQKHIESTDRLSAGIGRIDTRVKERQRKVLKFLQEKEPALLELRELLREKFDAKIVWFSGGGIEYGADVKTIPVSPPLTTKKERLAESKSKPRKK